MDPHWWEGLWRWYSHREERWRHFSDLSPLSIYCNDTKNMMTIIMWPLSPCPSWLMPQVSKATSSIFKNDGWYHIQVIKNNLHIIVAQFWKFEKFVIIEGKIETSPIILSPRHKHCEYFGLCPPTCHSMCLCTQGCAYTHAVCPCEGFQNL